MRETTVGRAVHDAKILTRCGIDEVTFIDQYLVHLDPEQAVQAALAINNPDFLLTDAEDGDFPLIATQLLSRIPVQEAINARLMEAVQRQRVVTAGWVLDQATVVYNKCMQIDTIKSRDGEDITPPFNPVAALRALEIVGKHVDIQAFKEVIELESGPNLAASLDMARKRIESRPRPQLIEQDEDITDVHTDMDDLLA